MKKLIFSVTAAIAIACAVSCGQKEEKVIDSGTAGAGDQGYTYKLTVDNMQFNWRIEGNKLHVLLRAPVLGWLSAGFNPTKGMQDANMIIGYIEDGKPVVTDQHGIDPKHHKKDTELGGEDNVSDASGSQKDGVTEIGFTIPLQSTDKLDKPILPDNVVVMLAYGKSNQLAQQHVFWAKARLNLSNGAYAVTLLKKG